MTSTLILYKNCAILPQRNIMVDDIEEYLATLENITIENYMYQKLDIEMQFKIDISQSFQEMTDLNNYNYASIQNESGKKYYFFLADKKPRAKETVRLNATLDSVNSIRPGIDFEISSKTHINRQHKDRFIGSNLTIDAAGRAVLIPTEYIESESMYYASLSINLPATPRLYKADISFYQEEQRDRRCKITINSNSHTALLEVWDERPNEMDEVYYAVRHYSKIRRIVDEYGEGLTPVLYKRDSIQLNQTINENWYLVYRNRDDIEPLEYNQDNPVECFIVPEYGRELKILNGSGELEYNDLNEDYTYFSYLIGGTNSLDTYFNGYDSNSHIVSAINLVPEYSRDGFTYLPMLLLRRVNGGMEATTFSLVRDENGDYSIQGERTQVITRAVFYNTLYDYGMKESSVELTAGELAIAEANNALSIPYTTQYIYGLNTIDRTDAKLIKIIETPYCPLAIENDVVIGTVTVTAFNTASLKLVDINTKFSYRYEFIGVDSPLKPLEPYDFIASPNDLKSADNESKLYHSDYYAPKVVYDSFGFNYNLEKVDYSAIFVAYTGNLLVDYFVTSTINSRFAFIFPDYKLKLSLEDFDNVLVIARNNERVLYTSQYINYLRTGYNYDVKSKRASEVNAVVRSAGSIVGAIAAAAVGVATENPYAIVSAVTAGVHSFTTLVSSVNSIAVSEASFEAKQLQQKNQAVSVAGSDDVDIMEAYSSNRAYLNTYRVSDRLRNALFELFFYTGYSTDEFGAINFNTRKRFNFISCDLVVKTPHNLPNYALLDIIEKYKYLTIIHHSDNMWDFEQEYENWEVSLGE